MKLARNLLDWFYPRRCLSCKRDLRKDMEKDLCKSCYRSIQSKHWHLKDHYSFGLFHGALRDLIHAFKYKGRRDLCEILASFLHQTWIQYPLLQTSEVLLPVPLHSKRLRERGYNQSALLAESLSRRIQTRFIPIPLLESVLIRKKYEESQMKLNRNQRVNNRDTHFFIGKPSLISGKKILLIDDVMTTGSTLNACTHILLKGGARKVQSLTIAYTPLP